MNLLHCDHWQNTHHRQWSDIFRQRTCLCMHIRTCWTLQCKFLQTDMALTYTNLKYKVVWNTLIYWLFLLNHLFLQLSGTPVQAHQRTTIFFEIFSFVNVYIPCSDVRRKKGLLVKNACSLPWIMLPPSPWKFLTPVSLEVWMTSAVDVISIVYQVTCSSVLAGVWVTPVCLKEKDQFQFEGKSRESIVCTW